MPEKYLDITKSVIISSPAGSGKTEKLARRYISLLESGSEIEKILCITFTEKAAAEMKERILSILQRENNGLFTKLREKMPLMRITTIHAFCLKLLKRFSIELGLDPALDIMDEFEASILWSEAVYDCLIEERRSPSMFFDMMRDRGLRGWDNVYSILDSLHKKRPLSEILAKKEPPAECGEEIRILQLYSKCLHRYKTKKLEKQLLDFNDLEMLAYDALMGHSEWQNILYAFDEHTDHILVDEFQDTSSMQWKIIDKLTEEWRSGEGAKRYMGKTPTIFLVGDNKQSIYLFRGANVSVFQKAKEKLSAWLRDEYSFEEVRENFRSLPEIINFANSLFSKLMPPALYENWRTRYSEFEATRKGDGRVELILVEADDTTKKSREKEAAFLAKRIKTLVNKYEVFDSDIKRPCIYGDMAILLKKRTHLLSFENALRKEGIPFIVVKGIGFYNEPEAALLRELLSFIIDPLDDYSLFSILRSPLFGVDYETLIALITRDEQPLIDKLQAELTLFEAYRILNNLMVRSKQVSLAMLLEETLTTTGGWRHYWEKQRQANIKKFIKIIESYESAGFSGLEIREKLIKAKEEDEAKANINTEGMNAVRIMTIHAAKGLQFPLVFIPSLDEPHSPKSSSIVIDEEDEQILIAYEEDSSKRKKMPQFEKRKEKEIEEEKRLFYVAITRARDFLCMLGAFKKDKPVSGRLAYLTESFEIFRNNALAPETDFFSILTESEIESLCSSIQPSFIPEKPSAMHEQGPVYTEPLMYKPEIKWRDVTEDIDIRIKHGEDWVLLGRIFHKLFEELSKNILQREKIQERALFLLKSEALPEEDIRRLVDIIIKDFKSLDEKAYLNDIILPRNNASAELPFVLQKGNTIFKGRVDRIISDNDTAVIYDYKTFPVKDSELPELIEKYRFQMDIYKEAVSKILSMNTKSFLVFTHIPMIVEI